MTKPWPFEQGKGIYTGRTSDKTSLPSIIPGIGHTRTPDGTPIDEQAEMVLEQAIEMYGLDEVAKWAGIDLTPNFSQEYRAFQDRYWSDPAGFAKDCLFDGLLYDHQIRAANDLVKHHYVAIRSLNGTGKTHLLNTLILWFALTRAGQTTWKIPITAGLLDQAQTQLWDPFKAMCEDPSRGGMALWEKIGREPFNRRKELLETKLMLPLGSAYLFAPGGDDVSKTRKKEGAHAKQMLVVFDEAEGLSSSIYESMAGASANAAKGGDFEFFWVIASTTAGTRGEFYKVFQGGPGYGHWKKHWWKLEDGLKPRSDGKAALTSPTYIDWLKLRFGETSKEYKRRALGEFADDKTGEGIDPDKIAQCQARWRDVEALLFPKDETPQPGQPLIEKRLAYLGVDVGGGGDPSMLTPIWEYSYLRNDQFTNKPTKEIKWFIGRATALDYPTGREVGEAVIAYIIAYLRLRISPIIPQIIVDGIGIGKAVIEYLENRGYEVLPFIGNGRDKACSKVVYFQYHNNRALAYGGVQRLIEGNDQRLCLPPSENLEGDLRAIRITTRVNGDLLVNAKDGIRDTLGRSPDEGDSLIYGMWPIIVDWYLFGDDMGGAVYTSKRNIYG